MLASIDGVPRSLLNGLNRIKRDDTVEVEQIREMMVTVQNIRQKTEVELKRFEGLGIYEDVGEETTVNFENTCQPGRSVTCFKLSFIS